MKRLEEWQPADDGQIELLRRLKRAVQQQLPGAQVVLFGSRARGEALWDSDYDLVVLTPEDPTPALKQKTRDCLYDVALDSDVVVSTLVYSRRQWEESPWCAAPLHQRVEEEGVLL